MTWDRFDICAAWYVFCVEWHSGQNSFLYKKLSQLSRMKFKPGLGLQYGQLENENQQEIYDALTKKFLTGAQK